MSTANPEQIREEIEAARAELGETVEALSAKTDVVGRAKRRLERTPGGWRTPALLLVGTVALVLLIRRR